MHPGLWGSPDARQPCESSPACFLFPGGSAAPIWGKELGSRAHVKGPSSFCRPPSLRATGPSRQPRGQVGAEAGAAEPSLEPGSPCRTLTPPGGSGAGEQRTQRLPTPLDLSLDYFLFKLVYKNEN